jgi:hypothetical protein
MKSRLRVALAVALVSSVGFIDAGTAFAQTTGGETFHGVIVASGRSGSREVVSSVVVAKGVFRGVGRIVEVESLPTDPENVSRDDLVFRQGTMHISVVNVDFEFSLNPRTCIFTVSVQQTGQVEGGTGLFAAAEGSFTGSVNGGGLLPRNPDRTCSEEQAPIIEVDTISASGTLTF